MIIEDPEPPSKFKTKREYFNSKLSLFVVRDETGKFITALKTKHEAHGWIMRKENNSIRRPNSR